MIGLIFALAAGGADAGVSCGFETFLSGADVAEAVPSSPGSLEDSVGASTSASASVGGTAALAGVLITLLVSLLRAQCVGAPVHRIPPRYRALVPGVLGLLAGVLAYVGGMTPEEAMQVALYSGPTAVFAHEAVSEGLLNKRRTRARTARSA